MTVAAINDGNMIVIKGNSGWCCLICHAKFDFTKCVRIPDCPHIHCPNCRSHHLHPIGGVCELKEFAGEIGTIH